jgi:hypothetical protein
MISKKEIIMWQMVVWGVVLGGLCLLTLILYNLPYDFRPIVIGISVSAAFVVSACLTSLRTAIITSIFILIGSFIGGIVFSGTVLIGVFLVGHARLEKQEMI